ncbi:MAG TPA: XamI family restriction endonuclease [Chloroflexaceae bacterium]|mgnify:CR=1 FL=1|nr:XamI family restriction endonuclease [Chloroflexaceae bacterium]
MSQAHLLPLQWTREQLEADRHEAVARFRDERMAEPLEVYLEAFDTMRGSVEEFLELTVDLTDFSQLTPEVLGERAMMDSLRYLAGPPISLDDLKTLVDQKTLSLRSLQQDPDLVQRLVSTVLAGLDRRRFPWVSHGREPEEHEREAAILASTALIAAQRTATTRRHEGKETQERAVREALLAPAVGFTQVRIPRNHIRTPSQAPRPGQFSGEVKLGTRKADLVVGLWDERIMAIECKVSNSFVNSIKRLNNDAAAKAEKWYSEFGHSYVVPVAVLSGLYELHHLEQAQGRGLALIWAHRLDDLTNWIARTQTT